MSHTQALLAELHARLQPECSRIERLPNGLALLLPLHPERPRQQVFGTVKLEPYAPAPDTLIELLTVEWILFRDLPAPLPEQTIFRLHELSGLALFGRFYINAERQLCCRYTCTAGSRPPAETAELVELVCYEMLLFLNIHHDYLFLCVTAPEHLTAEEYLQRLSSAAEPEPPGSEREVEPYA